MSKRIVCGVCGGTVTTFEFPDEISPNDLLRDLRAELVSHDKDPVDLDAEDVLAFFSIVDADNESEPLALEMSSPELFFYGDSVGWW